MNAKMLEMLALKRQEYETCAWELHTWGDLALSKCLWRLGFAPTDFGPYLLGDAAAPLMDSWASNDNWTTPNCMLKHLADAQNSMSQQDSCDTAQQHLAARHDAKLVMGNMLSWHVKTKLLLSAFNNSSALATTAVAEAVVAVEQYQMSIETAQQDMHMVFRPRSPGWLAVIQHRFHVEPPMYIIVMGSLCIVAAAVKVLYPTAWNNS